MPKVLTYHHTHLIIKGGARAERCGGAVRVLYNASHTHRLVHLFSDISWAIEKKKGNDQSCAIYTPQSNTHTYARAHKHTHSSNPSGTVVRECWKHSLSSFVTPCFWSKQRGGSKVKTDETTVSRTNTPHPRLSLAPSFIQ